MGRTINIDRAIESWGVKKAGIVRLPQDHDLDECIELILRIGRTFHEGFVIDENNCFVYENIALWMIASPEAKAHDELGNAVPADLRKGLYIAGRTGTGKSLLLKIFSVFAKILTVEYEVNAKRNFLGFGTYRADLICDDYAREGDLQKFKQMPILCIEDLGAEEQETLYMGNRRSVLRSILEARADKKHVLTFATTNIPINRIGSSKDGKERYGDRVQSRAYEMFNYYILGGKDRRVQE